jgi:hypothetical protein
MTLPVKKNRRWIWFFVVVFTLAILATVTLVVFNLQQQLTPEQLAAARKLWSEKGPRDYTMTYTTRVNEDTNLNHYWVKVRGGKVVASTYNGSPEPSELLHYRGMDGRFDDIERFMKLDSEKGSPKVFVRAIFDGQNAGALRSYVRRVMGGRQRVEINVDPLIMDGP